jgi:hypothetical protein
MKKIKMNLWKGHGKEINLEVMRGAERLHHEDSKKTMHMFKHKRD